MPGRTPQEAYENFLDPIKRAVACLGTAKITNSANRFDTDRTHVWTINLERGMALSKGGHFEAQMHYVYVRLEDGSGWRVSTRGYRYKFSIEGEEQFRMDWHPNGTSPYTRPHIHFGDDAHHPTPRFTLEEAVQWVLASGAITPAREDWEEILETSHDLHVKHRSWSDQPPKL